MSAVVHSVAKLGFGTGTNELYDQARPSYQAHGLAHIRQAVAASPPFNIVEIGSGTGIFTRALLSSPEWVGAIGRIRAVEPSAGMREQFAKSTNDSKIIQHEGTFDNTGAETGCADLVVVAQAFHWCPDYNAACAEFARILKPNGVVAFIWNLEDRDGARWVAQLRERIEAHEEGTPQFRLNLWRRAFETPSYEALFLPPEETTWSYTIPGTVAIAVNRACSKSYIAVLPEADKTKVVEDVKAIVERGDDMIWIDKAQGVFGYPYKTYVVISRKK